MANRQEIIDRAEELASGVANDPKKSVVVDSDITAEFLLPHAFRYVYGQGCLSGNIAPDDLLTDHSIVMVANVGVLPDTVLKRSLDYSSIPAELYSSYVSYLDYTRSKFASNQITYYAVKGNSFYCTLATSPIVLRAPALPAFPADVTDDIPVSDAVIDNVVIAIANVLRGSLPLAKLVEDY